MLDWQVIFLRFTKVHGLGNDFLLIEQRGGETHDFNALAPRLCSRNTGVGADGILLVLPSDAADVRMRIINSDGSEAEMCGNGIRCFAKYVYERGVVPKTEFSVETLGGVMRPRLLLDGAGRVTGVRVDMGPARLLRPDIPAIGEGTFLDEPMDVLGKTLRVTALNVGIPHAVVFVDSLDELDISAFGSAIEHAPCFPNRTNVDFVHVLSETAVELRTWERGCGRTLCCGTGASATAAACALNGKTGRSVDVFIELGMLHIDWADDNHMYMTGPAELVFDGELPL